MLGLFSASSRGADGKRFNRRSTGVPGKAGNPALDRNVIDTERDGKAIGTDPDLGLNVDVLVSRKDNVPGKYLEYPSQ